MYVCDNCKTDKNVHRDITFGFPTCDPLPGRPDTAVMSFYGIHGDYCETCLKKYLKAIDYEPKSAHELSEEEKREGK